MLTVSNKIALASTNSLQCARHYGDVMLFAREACIEQHTMWQRKTFSILANIATGSSVSAPRLCGCCNPRITDSGRVWRKHSRCAALDREETSDWQAGMCETDPRGVLQSLISAAWRVDKQTSSQSVRLSVIPLHASCDLRILMQTGLFDHAAACWYMQLPYCTSRVLYA